MYLDIIREDITKIEVDAIVNPSNPYLIPGDLLSVSGQIYKTAGYKQLNNCCIPLSPINWGEAVITSGFNLPSKHIIHVANPIWEDGQHHERDLLKHSYQSVFDLVVKHNLKSIAFPILSAGTYQWPKDEALSIALSEIQSFIMSHDVQVLLLVYDKSLFELSKKLSNSVKDYIDEHFETFDTELNINKQYSLEYVSDSDAFEEDLEELLKQQDNSFSDQLFQYIDEKQLSEIETYKRANVSKAVFSKIRSNKNYVPSKSTAFAFCIALKLNKKEAINLLNKAGLSFSPYSKQDIIVEYFIKKKNYDLFELNAVLYDYDQALLGSNSL